MKPGAFALNPYAASYIPLSKREAYVGGDESMWGMPTTHLAQNQPHGASLSPGSHGTQRISSPEVSTGKKPSAQDSYGSFSQKPGEVMDKMMRDEDLEMDMDMEYLQMTFPGLSHESVADVYLANNGDLEGTIDMLTQLEIYSSESPENLPDSLDIGDVSESGPSTSCAPKQRNAVTVAGASSSGSPDAAVSS